jgi:hypothetical protein
MVAGGDKNENDFFCAGINYGLSLSTFFSSRAHLLDVYPEPVINVPSSEAAKRERRGSAGEGLSRTLPGNDFVD